MARFGFTITKRTSFRLVNQEFSNTYYYESLVWVPSDTALSNIIDEIVATERKLHSIDVTFVRGQCWSAGGTPAQNVMRVQKSLTGVGNGTAIATLDRERAILIRWPAGTNVLGRPVYLRKWYHVCGDMIGTAQFALNGVLQNTTEIAGTARIAIAAIAEELREVNPAETAGLVAATGRQNTGGAQCHRFLEHHQLGDMWR